MDLRTYQKQASRTCPDLGSLSLNISHMIMGMVSELEELDVAVMDKEDNVGIGEELTDKHWYLANYCRLYDIPYESLDYNKVEFVPYYDDVLRKVVRAISKLTDIEKKLLAYGKPVSDEVRLEKVQDVFNALETAYNYFGIDRDQCLQNNINKLKIRFPEKFDAAKAINRDVERERVELEK